MRWCVTSFWNKKNNVNMHIVMWHTHQYNNNSNKLFGFIGTCIENKKVWKVCWCRQKPRLEQRNSISKEKLLHILSDVPQLFIANTIFFNGFFSSWNARSQFSLSNLIYFTIFFLVYDFVLLYIYIPDAVEMAAIYTHKI